MEEIELLRHGGEQLLQSRGDLRLAVLVPGADGEHERLAPSGLVQQIGGDQLELHFVPRQRAELRKVIVHQCPDLALRFRAARKDRLYIRSRFFA